MQIQNNANFEECYFKAKQYYIILVDFFIPTLKSNTFYNLKHMNKWMEVESEFFFIENLIVSSPKSLSKGFKVLANWDFTLVHKYYINRISLSQD